MARGVALCLLLAGCFPGTHVPDSTTALKASWIEHGLPPTGDCPLEAVEVPRARFKSVCTYCPSGMCPSPDCPWGCAAACTRSWGGAWVAVLLDIKHGLQHEFAHAMSACAFGTLDHGHKNPAVWCDWLGDVGGVPICN